MAYSILALVINKATEVGKTAMKKLKLRNRILNTKDGNTPEERLCLYYNPTKSF